MRMFVAGAAGAIGTQLVGQLVARGHVVVGMTRSAAKHGALQALGAAPVVADALDRDAVVSAVGRARPEIVVHQLSSLAGELNMRRIDRTRSSTTSPRRCATGFPRSPACSTPGRRGACRHGSGAWRRAKRRRSG